MSQDFDAKQFNVVLLRSGTFRMFFERLNLIKIMISGWISPWIENESAAAREMRHLPTAVSTWGPKIPPAVGRPKKYVKLNVTKTQF